MQKRLEKGLQSIKDAGGFEEAPKHWLDAYQELAVQALEYEIDNDLLPI